MEKEEKQEGSEEAEEKQSVKWLFELSKKDIAIVGGKGANLAEIFNKKLPVPPAFIVTAQAYEEFIIGIKDEIQTIVDEADIDDVKQLNEASKKIRQLIEKQKLSAETEQEIIEAYETFGTKKQEKGQEALDILNSTKDIFVAVRSSATTEDLKTASFAGQQDTFLNVKGKTQLLQAIKKCFSSLYTARAIFYREKRGFSHSEALIAVIVQKMINSDTSGVIFTKNPVKESDNVVIEAVFGLGEGIVSGKIKPDQYIINRKIEILDKKIADKKIALVKKSSGEQETLKLTEEKSKSQVLTNSEIERLADYSLQIEKHYKKPQDIEFAIENREIYIVQTRPITTEAKKGREIDGKVLLSGLPASPGVASGKVKIIHNFDDLYKIKKGDILVTEMTNPDMVVTMQKSDAIVTDEGGLTSHASIVSREMGIPAVVGTGSATSLLKDDMIITVDGSKGKIYEGEIGEEKKAEILPVVETKTKIKVILDLPDFAERAAETKVKGVGLLRLEGIIAESGKHPLMFLVENRLEDYIKLLERAIEKISQYFNSIWIRTSDIRTDEFRNLEGSPKEQEINPMLGFHGIRFSLKNPQILEAELEAIKKIADKNPDKQFGVMFPQIISVKELRQAKKIFEKFKVKNMKLGVMIETPAACEIISELCDEGIDFMSIGTNDLTQYTLAVDRGNENIQGLYDEMSPAVLSQIKRVISVCKGKNVETSICGQAGSEKEMVRFLIRQGIDSISVNADAAHNISEYVAKLENKVEEKPEKSEETEIEEQEIEEKTEEQKPKEKEKAKEFPDTKIGFDVFAPKIEGKGDVEQMDKLESVEEKIEEKKEIVEEKKEEKEEENREVEKSIKVESVKEQEEKSEEKPAEQSQEQVQETEKSEDKKSEDVSNIF